MKPRRSALDPSVATTLAATEYRRCLDLLRSLAPGDWTRPTDCPDWDVRQLSCHLLGMVELAASVRELLRTQLMADRAAARSGRAAVDELTGIQVAERAHLSPHEIITRFELRYPRAVAGRRRMTRLFGGLGMPGTQRVNGADEPWTIGFLTDVILTRDPWMHRIDLHRATGAPLLLTSGHDAVLVADVVAEWTDRHGKDYELVLDGPAGGRWQVGANGPQLRAGTVEFLRALSGRSSDLTSAEILSTEVPF